LDTRAGRSHEYLLLLLAESHFGPSASQNNTPRGQCYDIEFQLSAIATLEVFEATARARLTNSAH
jgi:hypothetical protein